MKLVFNANALVAAERSAGKSFPDIIAELESKDGASLTTIRALLAAGTAGGRFGEFIMGVDDLAAGREIDKHGIDAVAVEIGRALRAYFDSRKVAANG